MKRLLSIFLLSIFAINMCGCALNSKVVSYGDDFMNLVMNMKFSKMKKVAEDYEVFDKYADDELLAAILGRGEYEADKKSLSESDKKASVTYVVTLPDYEEVIDDGDYDDIDEFIDNLEDADTTTIKVKVEFKLKNDAWIVTNCEDIAEDLFEEILDNDFGLGVLSNLTPITSADLVAYSANIGEYIEVDPETLSISGNDEDGLTYMGCIWLPSGGYIMLNTYDSEANALKDFEDSYGKSSWYSSMDGTYVYQTGGNGAVMYCDAIDGSLDVYTIAYCVGNSVVYGGSYDGTSDSVKEVKDFFDQFGYPTDIS